MNRGDGVRERNTQCVTEGAERAGGGETRGKLHRGSALRPFRAQRPRAGYKVDSGTQLGTRESADGLLESAVTGDPTLEKELILLPGKLSTTREMLC